MTSTDTTGPSTTRTDGPQGSPGLRSPRGRRGTIATIVAVVVVVVAAAAAVEAIYLAMHRRTLAFDVSTVAKYGRDTHLDDSVVLIVGIVAFVVGVLLIIAALLPPRRRLVELSEPDRTIAAGLTRRSLRRTLAAAALGVDGISQVSVSGRKRIKVKATTSLRSTDALPDRVRQRVTDRLDELNPVRTHRVRVSLKRKDD